MLLFSVWAPSFRVVRRQRICLADFVCEPQVNKAYAWCWFKWIQIFMLFWKYFNTEFNNDR